MKLLSLWIAVLSMGFWVSCSKDQTAGGSSEETNAIAGVVVDGSGKPVANAWVEIRSTAEQYQSTTVKKASAATLQLAATSESYRDTTDSLGRWDVDVSRKGLYTVLSGDAKGRMSLRNVDLQGDVVVRDTLLPSVSFQTTITCRWGLSQGLLAVIPGTMFHAYADSFGVVQFDSLPQGEVNVKIISPDVYRYEDIQVSLQLDAKGVSKLWGPYNGSDVLDSAMRMAVQSEVNQLTPDVISLPLRYDYGVRGWWAFDQLKKDGSFQFFLDSKGRSGDGVVYGGSLVDGQFNSALHLNGSGQFGVIESVGSVFDSMGTFSLEVWFKLNAEPSGSAYLRNLVGQMGISGADSNDLFSLALVKNGDDKIHVGFLLSDGISGVLDSAKMVRSNASVVVGEWNYVLATWDGMQTCISVNAQAFVCREQEIEKLQPSALPLYFGKEDLDVVLDEIRIVDVNMDQNDARYRWLRRLQ